VIFHSYVSLPEGSWKDQPHMEVLINGYEWMFLARWECELPMVDFPAAMLPEGINPLTSRVVCC